MPLATPRTRRSWPVLVLLALTCTACLRGPYPWDMQVISPAPSASPAPDKALVCFYRTASLYPLTSFWVHDGFERIGILSSETFFFYQAAPGKHLFWAEVDFRGDIVLDCQPGEVYYLRCDLSLSGLGLPDRPVFTRMSKSRGAEEIRDGRYAVPR